MYYNIVRGLTRHISDIMSIERTLQSTIYSVGKEMFTESYVLNYFVLELVWRIHTYIHE